MAFLEEETMYRLSLAVVAVASFVLACADIMPGWR